VERCGLVEDPLVGEQFRPYAMSSLLQMSITIEIKLATESLVRWNNLSTYYPF
jgi:hypothetical protein